MEILVYRQKKPRTPAIENLLESKEKETGSKFSYIFFIFAKSDNANNNTEATEIVDTIKTSESTDTTGRTNTNPWSTGTSHTRKSNIYCLTYGGAHDVIRGFEDTKFPRDVSKYAAKKEIRRFDVRNPRGTCYAVDRSYHNPRVPDRLEVKGEVAKFQGRVGSPLLKRFKFLKEGTEKGARIEVTRYGVRFMKYLTMKEMCELIKELDDDRKVKNIGGCDIMDYVFEVEDRNTIDRLEEKMFDKVLEYVIKDWSGDTTDITESAPHPYDVMYKDLRLPMKGKDFKLHFPCQRKHTVIEDLGSFDDIVRALGDFLKDSLLERLELAFMFDEMEVENRPTFVTCLHGDFQHEQVEYFIEAGEFKRSDGKTIDRKSYQNLKKELLAQILKDMTKDDANDEGNNLTQFSLRKDEKPDIADHLKQLKSDLAKTLNITFEVNQKSIEDLMLNYFHGEVVLDDKEDESQIYNKVDGRWFEIEHQYSELLQQSFQKLLSRKFKDGTSDNIHLPKEWPIGKREDYYNQLYKDEADFYVGDKIKPLGIELCDIMKLSADAIYLYHVEVGFGQSTRSACLQIRNSASQISVSMQGGGQENYLEKYYEYVTNYNDRREHRMKFKERLLKEGKKEFLKWFQSKNIVFVYAFGNTIREQQDGSWSEDKKLREFKDKNVEKFSRSTLARQELCDTNVYLEELGFEFAICQILDAKLINKLSR